MKCLVSLILVVLVSSAACAQSATSATPAKSRAVAPNPAVQAAISQTSSLTGSALTQALVTIYTSSIGFGPDVYGLGPQIAASVAACTNSADQTLAASYVLQWPFPSEGKKAALAVIDTSGLPPEAQRVANGLGVLLGRCAATNLVPGYNLNTYGNKNFNSWLDGTPISLKRVLTLIPVTNNAGYMATANLYMAQSQTSNLSAVSASYQVYLQTGSGGADLLAGVTLPTASTDPFVAAATAELARTDITIDQQVDMQLLCGNLAAAFTLANANLGNPTVNAGIYRMAKVIKALDGNWKRATDYVNLFQPVPPGGTAPPDPIPAVKASLGL
jgi:hypothetical protein